jgi:uncharacterized membrane protein
MILLGKMRHGLAFLLAILSTTILAQAQGVDNAEQTPMQAQAGNPLKVPMRIVAYRDPHAKAGATVGVAAAPAGAHLTYFGGPVISNVHVVEVLYGSGSYLPEVAGTTTPNMETFFSDLTGTNSGYISLLTQYDTPASGGTGQTIGNGTFDGLFQIVPSPGNDGATIDDTQIQAELLAQISAGHLPGPLLDAAGNVNTLYMIYFPPGKTITLSGSQSCVAGGFCAYHGTTSNTFEMKNLLYGVLPDLQAGSCSVGCGTSSVFGNYTSVSSHELTEAITDADVGIATVFGPPLAWYDMPDNAEIGDLCNGQQGSYVANGTTYTIQLEFSNAANNCVLPTPAPSPNFTLSASPASLTATQGNSGNSTITVTPSGGFKGSVNLSASGLPSGVTATFGTNPTTSTSVVTLAASSSATTGTFTVTITGTSGTLTHTTTISLTVKAVASPNFSLSASPSSVTVVQGNSGNTTISVTPSGGFTGSVSLSASGLPSGVTATFGTNPTTSTGVLTFTASATAATGAATVTITGTSGTLSHSTTVRLTVNSAAQADFTISDSPTSITVTSGATGHSTVTIGAVNGFTGTVSLSVSGLPSGASATFSPNTITNGSGNSTMSVTTSSSTPAGTYTLTITGTSTSPSLTHSTTVTLVVNTASTGNFSLSASLSSQTVTAGNSASYTATITPAGGFTGSVTLSVSGLPSGATARFTVNPVAGSGNSTLTVNTSSSTPTGSYTLTITGTSTSPSLTHSTTVTLVVNSFSVSASPSSETVTRGSNATYTVTVMPINGFTGTVTFRVSGLPTNSTATFNPTSVTGRGTSTLTITTNSSTTTGTFSLRIRGTSSRASHNVTVQLVVQ